MVGWLTFASGKFAGTPWVARSVRGNRLSLGDQESYGSNAKGWRDGGSRAIPVLQNDPADILIDVTEVASDRIASLVKVDEMTKRDVFRNRRTNIDWLF